MTIRVLVVDDHPVVRHGVQHLLASDPEVEVVGEADSGAQALEQVANLEPDLVILDMLLPGSDGVAITRQLRRRHSDVKIIVLTAYRDEEYLLGALRAGAHAYLLKQASHEVLCEAIHRAYQGERLLSPVLVSRVLEEFELMAREQSLEESQLAQSDLEILNRIASGDSTRDIAQTLHWSEATVNRRVQEILIKLNVANRAHAVAEAIRRGLI
ncbi:MAG: response regulator transcription factor [Ardenticatenaceae bacterium]|nr:response regulator transcription factor [Ardenticatenaceae bacterium]